MQYTWCPICGEWYRNTVVGRLPGKCTFVVCAYCRTMFNVKKNREGKPMTSYECPNCGNQILALDKLAVCSNCKAIFACRYLEILCEEEKCTVINAEPECLSVAYGGEL